MKQKEKQKIIVWLLIFAFSLMICFAFLKPHYTYDTYKIVRDGYEFYACDKFIKEARPITALLTMGAEKIHLPIDIYIVVSFIIGIALLSLAVVILYEIFKGKIGKISKIKQVVLLLISYITIFGYLTIEHILFLETCIITLGVLLSVIACKVIIDNEKYKMIKAFMILFIAVFCYQGSIAIFPIIMLTYYAIIEPLPFKKYIKETFKLAIMYGILMLLTILYVKFIIGGSRIQIGAVPFEFLNIVNELKRLVVYSLKVVPPFVHIGIIVFTSIFLLLVKEGKLKEKMIIIFQYYFITIAAIAICIMPIVSGSGLRLEPRMCMAYGTMIGISLLFIFWVIKDNENDKNMKNMIVYICTFVIFILNSALYMILTNQHIAVNKSDKEIGERIAAMISEYEKSTGIRVVKLTGKYDPNVTKYLDGFIQTSAYNERATASWAFRETIVYYTQPMAFVSMSVEQYVQFFRLKDWDEFSEEQVHIEGDTLYFYVY